MKVRFQKTALWLLGRRIWALPFKRVSNRLSGTAQDVEDRSILFVSSNGSGLGHLTRLWAIEKALSCDAYTYTLSSAHNRLGKKREKIIYFPSYATLGMYGKIWNFLLAGHFAVVVKALQPKRIVFDGTTVYPGVIAVARRACVPITWIQRGCWKPHVDARSWQRHHTSEFADQVIIPGDYGCDEKVDVGQPADYVGPIVLTREEDLLSRLEARKALNLPLDKNLFLIQLGGASVGELNNLLDMCVNTVNALGPDWCPVVVRNPLSDISNDDGVLSISAYPLAQYYNAFDAAIMPAGYNTSQECVQFGLPSVLLPNMDTVTDDQERRAETLQAKALAISATSIREIHDGINRLADDEVRYNLRKQATERRVSNGAARAAQLISSKLS